MKHALVTPKAYFEGVVQGARTADIKKDDRPYGFGDEIILQEFDEAKKLYTGRQVSLTITSLMRNVPKEGLRRGFVFICFNTGSVIQNKLPEGYGEVAPAEEPAEETNTGAGEQAATVEVDSLKDLPDFLKEDKNSAEQVTGAKSTAKKGGK